MHIYTDVGIGVLGIEEQVIKSCRYLLLPVVRFVLRHGVSISEFTELTKEAYVLAARQDYGIDDMMWLIDASDRPGTVRVEVDGTDHYLPVAVFDNRTDKTSFLRTEPEDWPAAAVADLHLDLVQAFGRLRS